MLLKFSKSMDSSCTSLLTVFRNFYHVNSVSPCIDSVDFAISGQFYHCPRKGDFEYHADSLVLVDKEGNIEKVLNDEDPDYKSVKESLQKNKRLITLGSNEFLLPGMVDLHNHAPQWPQVGKGLDLPLFDWLQEYTFPLEAKYEDVNFARDVYTHMVKSLLSNGTTSAVYFSSIHNPSSLALAEICLEMGQRAFVGKVNMDNPSECPPFYIEKSTGQGLEDAESFIHDVRSLSSENNNYGLVQPVITPRFVPSCTLEMLKGLGELAQQYNDCHIQTHCQESDWAKEYTPEHYGGRSDVDLYFDTGLLTENTILAHSIFLDDDDIEKIKDSGASIAHCPFSNMYFANAAMRTREVMDRDLKVGLGTDLAGSPSPSIFHTCVDAVNHSRVREEGCNTFLSPEERGEMGSRITFLESYWMATVGGGISIGEKVGLIEPGYSFDALVVSIPSDAYLLFEEEDSTRDVLEKLICLTGRGNIKNVWVQGKMVIEVHEKTKT